VRNGRFAITVFARTEASGCGAPGSKISSGRRAQEPILPGTDRVRADLRAVDGGWAATFGAHVMGARTLLG
jgi:hypothetical protein